jgi:CRP/FNR family transcriptional regulator, cyclic AMP receptor protein
MNYKAFWGNPFKKTTTDLEGELAFLGSVPVFDSLSKRQIRKIHSIVHIRTFEKGEIVFRKGDPGVGLYIVRSGSVENYNEFPDLTRVKITDLAAGNFFGEISLLNDSPRSATAVSSCSTVLHGFFRHDLLELMDSDPVLGVKLVYRLAQIVAERLRLMNEPVGE